MPGGATSPIRRSASWSGTPASSLVGNVREIWRTLAADDGERAQLAFLDQRSGRRKADEAERVWPPMVELISGAAPWNGTRTTSTFMPEAKEALAGELAKADARAAVAVLARLLPGEIAKLLHRFCGHRGVRDHDLRRGTR